MDTREVTMAANRDLPDELSLQMHRRIIGGLG
jgi:hypothetical protein